MVLIMNINDLSQNEQLSGISQINITEDQTVETQRHEREAHAHNSSMSVRLRESVENSVHHQQRRAMFVSHSSPASTSSHSV